MQNEKSAERDTSMRSRCSGRLPRVPGSLGALVPVIAVISTLVTPTRAFSQAIDAVSTDSTLGSTLTVSHTTSGTDRLMVVSIGIRNDDREYAASVRYNGVNLSLVIADERSDDARVEVWQLVAPALGTHDLVITFNKDLKKAAVAGVMTFTGVDQTTPLGASASNNGKSTSANVTLSSTATELVLSVIDAKKPVGITSGPLQTDWWQLVAKSDEAFAVGSTQPGSGSVTASWTLVDAKEWAAAAVAIRAKEITLPDPPAPCQHFVKDEFTSINYIGNHGTVTWSNDWQELGETDGPGVGRVQVISPNGCASGNCLRIGGTGQSIQGRGASREADLTSADSATLTFTVARVGSGGSVTLAASANGGFSWTPLQTFTIGAGTPTTATERSVNLTPYIASNTQIRLLGSGTTGSPSYLYVDNLKVSYIGGAVSTTSSASTVNRLPSNGTQYAATFTVVNSGFDAEDFDLLTTHPDTNLNVVSISGPAVTQGSSPDSALLSGLAVDDSSLITVTYTIADVPVGAADTLSLRSRSRCNPISQTTAQTEILVVRPVMTTTKSVTPSGTVTPGTDLSYMLTIINSGSETAHNVVLLDSVAVEVQFKVGSVINTLPSGVSAVVEYSADAGATWTYVPTSEACGAPTDYDNCVTHIRWSLQSPLGYTAPDNAGQVTFVVRIE